MNEFHANVARLMDISRRVGINRGWSTKPNSRREQDEYCAATKTGGFAPVMRRDPWYQQGPRDGFPDHQQRRKERFRP